MNHSSYVLCHGSMPCKYVCCMIGCTIYIHMYAHTCSYSVSALLSCVLYRVVEHTVVFHWSSELSIALWSHEYGAVRVQCIPDLW